MRRHALLLALLLAPLAARAECSREDRTDMMQMGVSDEQIDAVCNIRPEAGSPAGGDNAFYCATVNGYCPLPGVEAAGLACSCDTAYGPVPGVTE